MAPGWLHHRNILDVLRFSVAGWHPAATTAVNIQRYIHHKVLVIGADAHHYHDCSDGDFAQVGLIISRAVTDVQRLDLVDFSDQVLGNSRYDWPRSRDEYGAFYGYGGLA